MGISSYFIFLNFATNFETMQKFKNSIPISLIYLRILIGIVLLVISVLHIECSVFIPVSLFTIGLLSDVFDGIIARRLGISSEYLRRMDSAADQVFWVLVATSVVITFPDFLKDHWIKLVLLIAIESLTYAVSYAKFGKEVATHAISSKIWTLIMFATLVQVMIIGNSNVLFEICFYTGILTRIEIVVILLLLRNWTNDVPSVFHAVRLRQVRVISRNKLFNG